MQNLVDLSKQFNWIDILVFLIFLRVIFVSLKNGLSVEFFKVLGIFCAAFAALHFYPSLADYLASGSGNENRPGAFFGLAAFVLIVVTTCVVFWVVRLLFSRYAELTIDPVLSRCGGLAAGAARAFLLTSIILFALLVTEIPYFKRSVLFSYTGSYCATVAPTTYTWFFKSIVSRLLPGQHYNAAVNEVIVITPKKK